MCGVPTQTVPRKKQPIWERYGRLRSRQINEREHAPETPATPDRVQATRAKRNRSEEDLGTASVPTPSDAKTPAPKPNLAKRNNEAEEELWAEPLPQHLLPTPSPPNKINNFNWVPTEDSAELADESNSNSSYSSWESANPQQPALVSPTADSLIFSPPHIMGHFRHNSQNNNTDETILK